MSVSLDELRDALDVNKHDLDEEWRRQPQLNDTIGELHDKAILHRDMKKQEIDEVRAELDEQFRKQAQEAEEKITETALKNKIATTNRMKKLEQELLDLTYKASRLATMRESCRQKNDALKGLTALHGQNYFVSESGGGKAQHDARKRGADDVRKQIGEGTRLRRNRE